jgi:hypothetical protein
VSVGIDHDTAEFAVNTIALWCDPVAQARYPNAKRLLITADSGGSNGNRLRAWKIELAALAAATGLDITVCHYPPGTSKWNKTEHRLFSFISINWRSRPLTDCQVIVETIAATTTDTGLTVDAVLDTGIYPTGARYSDAQVNAIPLTRNTFHGEWNYTIHSGPVIEPAPDNAFVAKRTK